MIRKISILALVVQCIIYTPLVAAGTGHTTNNGGGIAEIEYTGIWQTLEQIMRPCLHPASPCELTQDQMEMLKSALQKRPASPVNITAKDLYNPDGTALPRVELLTLALARALDCEGLLGNFRAHLLAKRVLEFKHYREFSGGRAVMLRDQDLEVIVDNKMIDLTMKLRQRMRLAYNARVQILDARASENREGIHIHGSVVIGPLTRVHFQFLVRPDGHAELMVFPS